MLKANIHNKTEDRKTMEECLVYVAFIIKKGRDSSGAYPRTTKFEDGIIVKTKLNKLSDTFIIK